MPVASCIIATEPISANLMRTLMPKGYMCSETRKLHYYYRPSPDGRRILFGGRGGLAGDARWPTPRLKRALVDIFPELDGTGVTHSWFGYVAMNRDMVPRIFSHDGIHYAAGYCGSGVVWARWAGQKAALNVLGGAQRPQPSIFARRARSPSTAASPGSCPQSLPGTSSSTASPPAAGEKVCLPLPARGERVGVRGAKNSKASVWAAPHP